MTRTESPSISISRHRAPAEGADHTVVWVRGEHDVVTKVSLIVAIARAALDSDAVVLVDLSGVTFMDASTIGAIVGSSNRLRRRSQSLAVRAPSRSASRVLELCGLVELAHPVAVAVTHPSGPAAALGTWVDVPPTAPATGQDSTAPTKAAGPVVDEPAHPAFATADADADRGGP